MNFKLKNLLFLFAIATISLTLSSCGEDFDCDDREANFGSACDDGDVLTVGDVIQPDCTCAGTLPGNIVKLEANITSNMTLTSDKIWILANRVSVESGATLTIEPGTVIKGQAGTGVNATALLIARGAKLMAEGTADAPIIFTSIADEITPEDVVAGNFASPNLDADINGYWGGLIVLGNATISASTSPVQIEGIPTSDTNGLYGGNSDDDSSGVIRYVSIRHGGSNIGEGNEINGLTLGGVGSETVIENIEIVGNQDDGIEWFGGTVDVTNAVVWNVGDDAIDTDQGWAGTLDNFVVITPAGSCFELDGPEGTHFARHTIQNGSVIAVTEKRNTGGNLIDVDGNPAEPDPKATPVDMINVHFVGPLMYEDDGESVFLTITEDEVEVATFDNVTLDVAEADLSNHMEQGGAVPMGISAGGTPQADLSGLGWTWAAQAGELDF